MPELPEVEVVRRGLDAVASGRRVARAVLCRADFLTVETPRPTSGCAARGPRAALLHGLRIARLHRHGKQIAFEAVEGPCLILQLGMSGEVLALPPADRQAQDTLTHVHAWWELDSGARVLFRDPRRFGGLTWYPSHHAVLEHRWSSLGPDALTIKSPALVAALSSTSRAVKAALLDQQLIAGVGNIYADEALHKARIAPHQPCTSLSSDAIQRLASAIRTVLAEAIRAGGSTIQAYRSPAGASGSYQHTHHVYARGGQPCRTCRSTLLQALIAQRSTVWCPACQPVHPMPSAPTSPRKT